jgi:hypothetical protein
MSSITIPANAIGRVREGAVRALHDCAEGIDQAGSHRASQQRVRHDLEGVWRLLDTIGWDADPPAAGVPIDPVRHGEALLTLLGRMLPVMEEWVADFPEGDPRRPHRRAEIDTLHDLRERLAVVRDTPEPQGTIAVPGPVIPVVRDGVFTLLGAAAKELSSQAQSRPDMRDLAVVAGERATIARVTGLLDEIGWTGELDAPDDLLHVAARRHGATVVAAMNHAIPPLVIGLDELGEGKEGERPQRETLLQQARSFARQVGAQVAAIERDGDQ